MEDAQRDSGEASLVQECAEVVSPSVANPGVSRTASALILFCFAILAAICLIMPVINLVEMLGAIAKHSASITIDKGVYYLFGIGIAFSFLLVDGLYNTVLRRPTSKAVAKLVNRTAIAGLVLVIAMPNLVHFTTAYHLERNDYRVCEELSSQWLFVRDIVYVHGDSC